MGKTMRRLALGWASLALAVVVLIACNVLARCRSGVVTECNYGKIKNGMTVREAEAALGPGRELGPKYVPTTRPYGPVIRGERFLRW